MKYLLHAPDDEMAKWKAAAEAAGMSFAEWLRQAAHMASLAAITHSHPPRAKPPRRERASDPPKRDTTGAASGMCVHRVPLDAYCGRC